jgi:hypothetical protein
MHLPTITLSKDVLRFDRLPMLVNDARYPRRECPFLDKLADGCMVASL